MTPRTAFLVLAAALLGAVMPESASAQKGGFSSGGKTMSAGGRPVATPTGQPRTMSTVPPHFHGGNQFHHGNHFHHGKHFHGTTFVTTAFVTPVWWGPWGPYWYPPPPPGFYGAPPPPPPGWYFCPAYNAYYPPNVPCPY